MKRLHVHIGVENLAESIAFYTALFGAAPVKTKPDYAKWMLDDPRVNFAISTRSGKVGIDHLGIQVDDGAELNALRNQMAKADIATHSDGEAVCCYARSEKSWIEDPSGVTWEAYHTMEEARTFAGDEALTASACCAPQASEQAPGCGSKVACC